MHTTPPSVLSGFVDTYHLWYLIILLVVLGIYELADIVIGQGYRLAAHAHEHHYLFKARCVEDRRRYERTLRSSENLS